MLRTYWGLRKGEELFFIIKVWTLHKTTEVISFVSATSQTNICFYIFVICYYISFLPAKVAVNQLKRIYASGYFMPMEINTCKPD